LKEKEKGIKLREEMWKYNKGNLSKISERKEKKEKRVVHSNITPARRK
jgi:hypothetical protein